MADLFFKKYYKASFQVEIPYCKAKLLFPQAVISHNLIQFSFVTTQLLPVPTSKLFFIWHTSGESRYGIG